MAAALRPNRNTGGPMLLSSCVSLLVVAALCRPAAAIGRRALLEDTYTFYLHTDQGGGDLRQMAGATSAQLKAACSADAACLAFNSAGWLKNSLYSKSAWYTYSSANPEAGLYVKPQAPPPPPPSPVAIAGYTFHSLKDSGGGDIEQLMGLTVAQLAEHCNALPECKGFNTRGWIKKAIWVASSWYTTSWETNPAEGLYVRSASSPAPSPSPSPDAASPQSPTIAAPAPAPAPTPASGPLPTAENLGLWIPFYVNPTSEAFNALITTVEQSACLAGSFKAAVLIGPNSGPPPKDSQLHRDLFSKLAKTQQWTTFGYIHTGYGTRPLLEVLAEVDAWLAPGDAGFGDLIQGIWVNQALAEFSESQRAYFDAIIDRIRFYGRLVALNPGCDTTDCAMATKADFVNAWETDASRWSASDAPCTCHNVTRCINSIHGYKGDGAVADLAEVMKQSRDRGFRATFLTDRVMPNHYSLLPLFWPAELAALCKVNI